MVETRSSFRLDYLVFTFSLFNKNRTNGRFQIIVGTMIRREKMYLLKRRIQYKIQRIGKNNLKDMFGVETTFNFPSTQYENRTN